MMRDDRGAGAVLALAVLGVLTTVCLAVLQLGAALSVHQRVVGAADAASLAAADGASGAIAGEPCDLAGRVATANSARLRSCRLDGLIATVEAAIPFGPLVFVARSTAGPPP